MEVDDKRLRIAILHPDLGIGGAERLIVDAAVGLQKLGHSIDIYTSHFDPTHCFDETRDGTLRVHYIRPPLPRSILGKLHIVFAILRQIHLTLVLLFFSAPAPEYDVYLVDQLSTCIPLIRWQTRKSVVFYCHFPDKLLADGKVAPVGAKAGQAKGRSLLKRLYRLPVDWLEEATTGQADIILANSEFTSGVFKNSFPSIHRVPRVVYPGIDAPTYEVAVVTSPEVEQVMSERPTFVSLNRFEAKKNAALAIKAVSKIHRGLYPATSVRLVIAGGYDPRVQDNVKTLQDLRRLCADLSLSYTIIADLTIDPPSPTHEFPDVQFILNFTTPQRTALLNSPSTRALLYTPTNEHFGIVPLEAMACGLPVLACKSGGPVETVENITLHTGTGWLKNEDPNEWAFILQDIMRLDEGTRAEIAKRCKKRVKAKFGMDVMSNGFQDVLREAVRIPHSTGLSWAQRFILLFVGITTFTFAVLMLIERFA